MNTLSYGWRDYDPAIVRFNKTDRFAEKYYDLSTYSYAGNNPVLFVDVQGDSLSVGNQYRGEINTILEQSFGKNASSFSYTKNGNLIFGGNKKNFSKSEKKAFKELNKILTSKTQYETIIENEVNIPLEDGSVQTVSTGQDGSKGDTAVYPEGTQNGVGILALNPNPEKINVHVIDISYGSDGKESYPNGLGQSRSFSMYENFWHGIGHLSGGAKNQGKAMEVENLGGAIRKNIVVNNGVKSYTPATIETKNYNVDHPKKQ